MRRSTIAIALCIGNIHLLKSHPHHRTYIRWSYQPFFPLENTIYGYPVEGVTEWVLLDFSTSGGWRRDCPPPRKLCLEKEARGGAQREPYKSLPTVRLPIMPQRIPLHRLNETVRGAQETPSIVASTNPPPSTGHPAFDGLYGSCTGSQHPHHPSAFCFK